MAKNNYTIEQKILKLREMEVFLRTGQITRRSIETGRNSTSNVLSLEKRIWRDDNK